MVPTTQQARDRVVARLVSRNPVLMARIQRAHELVKAGAVNWSAELGAHQVGSQSNPRGSYTVSLAGKSCTCPDQPTRAPHGWCKHLLAVAIVGMADLFIARQAFEQATSSEAREWRRLTSAYLARQRAAAAVVEAA